MKLTMTTASKVKMNRLKNKYLVIILGPTASGKTDTAIQVAEIFNTEIISADSRQLYKELKKGTAVPDESQLKKIRHHLIGTISVHDYYNASMYEQDVLKVLGSLYIEKDIVVMVGGSGMYIDVVCHGIDDLPAIDPVVRETLVQRIKNEGIQSIRLELKKLDPEYYSRTDLKNPKRILKALEVYYMTGTPYSAFLSGPKKERPFKIIKIGLNPDRTELYERINTRIDSMIEKGLVEEAKSFYGIKDCNALNTVGYKEIFEYLDGKMTLDQSVTLIKKNTRRYARRQLTWFRRDNEITWFKPEEIDNIIHHIKQETEKGKNRNDEKLNPK
jgi:tRNA dimethylallyltransferase